MPSKTKTIVVKPEVVSSNSGNISDITISAQLGGYPAATISYHKTSKPVKSAVPKDLIDQVAEVQKQMLSETPPTDEIVIYDGNTEGTFEGYVSRPSFNLTPGGIGASSVILQRACLLDYLNTSIYTSFPAWKDIESLPYGSGTYSSWMKSVLELSKKSWGENIASSTSMSQNTKDQLSTIDRQNADPLKIWYDILDNGEDSNPSLSKIGDGSEGGLWTLADSITSFVFNEYSRIGSDFLGSVLRGFRNQFQVEYVPTVFTNSAPSEFGRLIGFDSFLNNPTTKSVNLIGMSLAPGMSQILPIRKVATVGVPAPEHKGGFSSGAEFNSKPQELVTYPKFGDGLTAQTYAPAWMPNSIQTVTAPASIDTLKYDAATASDNEKKEREGIIFDNEMYDMLSAWTYNVFVDLRYAGMIADLTVALDITWELGKRYKVMAGGQQLFEGFLSGLNHKISSGAAGNSQAFTSLKFTHVIV